MTVCANRGARSGLAAATAAVLAGAAGLALAAPAGASARIAGAARPGAGQRTGSSVALMLRAMPAGTVRFGRGRHGLVTVHADMFGLTPGSSHRVDLVRPGRSAAIGFGTLTASSGGSADSTLRSGFAGRVPRGSRLVIRMGTGNGRVATEPIAVTRRLVRPGRRPRRLIAVEVSPGGVSYGTPRGRAAISYNASRQTLTVTVTASGVTPGPHAAHIHLGSCQSQGPVKYMLRDLIASRRGRIVHAVRVFTHVTAPIPASGWYLNIHQGNSGNILSNGQPTIFFRPLICANIRPAPAASSSVSAILGRGDVVTGVRAATTGNVVLTGGKATGTGTQNQPFLYQGPLARAGGAAVSVLTPPFPGVTSATFYGPDTHSVNPVAIPSGQVRAVGAYESSSAPAGVVNQGMLYLGPVSGPGGSWTSLDVPADGRDTVAGARACPSTRTGCFVMDTIAHSTMGDLVVGNYDLNPSVPGGAISGNGFIYNLARQQWTLLDLGGSMSSDSSLYGIWQDGGPASPDYTLAGGSSASGHQQAFLISYNETTGAFGRPRYYSYGNRPALATHFDGITAVPGGFNLVTISSAEAASMAFVPVSGRDGSFGPATWFPVNVSASALCPDGCGAVTGNTVYQNQVMGLYAAAGAALPGTYLATIARQ
jgi:hypothetical protein